MNKTCLIKQQQGEGDVLFLQKVAKTFISRGFQVIFPVIPQLLHVREYIKVDNLLWVDVNSDFPFKREYENCYSPHYSEDLVILPLYYANQYSSSWMIAKYQMAEIDHSDWADYLIFERNREKEDSLFEILGLEGVEYNFINETYGTFPDSKVKKEVKPSDNGLLNVYLTRIKGFTIFDWLKVIERATNIYTVNTSLQFLCEKADLKAESGEMFLWSRNNKFDNIDGIFNKKWTYQ